MVFDRVNTVIKANILLFISSIAFGSSFIATKIALEAYNPYIVAGSRLFLGSLAFLIVIKELKKYKVKKQDVLILIFIGFFEPFLAFIFECHALEYTSASQAGIVTAILPFMVAIGAWFFLREQFTPQKLIGFILAFIGVAWLTLSSTVSVHAPDPLLGNTLELMAMACATVSIIAIKRLASKYSWIFITASQVFVSSILFLPIILFHTETYNLQLNIPAVLAIVYLGLVVNVLAYGFYNYGVLKINASQASIYVNLIPVFAMIFGVLLLKETMTITNYLASIVVFIGVATSQFERMPVYVFKISYIEKIYTNIHGILKGFR